LRGDIAADDYYAITRVTAEDLVDLAECARQLSWQTAPDNLRAPAVYDRIGAGREQWVDYCLDVASASSSS
jgi:hypothetical protein